MPRRSLYLLLFVPLLSLLCHQYAQRNRFAPTIVEAMNRIESRALEPATMQQLFEGAMEGMMSRLDEYSAYIPPASLSEFHATIDQQFGGVGIEVAVDPESKDLVVMSPRVGTPAYHAGVRAGDHIVRIDGESTQGMALDEAVSRMRGKPGDPVTLTVLHEGAKEPVEMEIVRAIIQIETVLGDRRNPDGSWNYFLEGADKIGYLRIASFGENTGRQTRAALQWLLQRDMKGLVLDLRNNPGGLLTAACEVADLLLAGGVLVTTRDRDGRIQQEWTATPEAWSGFPVAVLVNKYSASAAEIVAAALQDHGRAVVVGQRTYGKGTVQEVVDLEAGRGALKLTTASYWRPSGKNIHRTRESEERDEWGVRPSKGFDVPLDAPQFSQWMRWRLRRDMNRPVDEALLQQMLPEEEGEPGTEASPLEPLAGDVLPARADRQLARALEYVSKSPRPAAKKKSSARSS